MHKRLVLLSLPILLAATQQAEAVSFGTFDPRSMAMGGTGVAAGTSANAGFFNPALLAAGRDGEDFSLEFPVIGARVAAPDDMVSSLDDFQSADYVDRFSQAVDQWNAATNGPELQAAKAAVVSTGRQLVTGLGTISNKALQGEVNVGAVVGIPSKSLGASVQLSSRAVGGGLLDVTQQDVTAINAVIDGLDNNATTGIVDGNGKLMQVTTFDYRVDVDTGDLSLDQGKKTYTDFNIDLGALHRYSNGWSTGVVVKNLIPQTYKTSLGNSIKLDPQARLGLAYEHSWITVASDIDLLENAAVGFDGPSQYLSLGAELNAWHTVQFRLGYRHNLSDSDTSVATVGFGLSPFGVHVDIAAMGNSNEVGAGLQLGFRF